MWVKENITKTLHWLRTVIAPALTPPVSYTHLGQKQPPASGHNSPVLSITGDLPILPGWKILSEMCIRDRVLSDHYSNSPETQEFVNIIKSNSNDLLRLVTDVLTLSELDQYEQLPLSLIHI